MSLASRRVALQNPRGDLSADAPGEKPVRAGAAFATNQSASRRQAIGYGMWSRLATPDAGRHHRMAVARPSVALGGRGSDQR